MTLRIPDIQSDDALVAALAYAAAGWYVAPIATGTKNPGSVLGAGWQQRTMRDPKDIAATWAGTSHGVALHAGRSGAVILDVDHPTNLPEVLLEAIGVHSPPMQSTRTDDPDRGHYLFLQPPGRDIGNSPGALGDTWGDVRGRNGVIVVAPSSHPDGGLYKWQTTGVLPPLPRSIADLIPDGALTADVATDAQVAAFLNAATRADRPTLLLAVTKRLEDAIARRSSRHNATVEALCWAMRESKAGLYTATDAASAIQQIFTRAKPEAAAGEWAGMLAWSISHALNSDAGTVRAATEQRAPAIDKLTIVPTPPATPMYDWSKRFEQQQPPEAQVEAERVDTPTIGWTRSWQVVDPTPVLDGTWTQPEPTIGARSDDAGILYPGKQHVAQGETEGGKSWFAACIAVAEMKAGNHVLYVDFEDDINTAVTRLRILQVPDQTIATHFHYVRPLEALGTGLNLDDLVRIIQTTHPTVAILDGVTEAMTLHGLDPLSNKDIAVFGRTVPKRVADLGPAVLSLDHVTKDRETRGKYALGGVHKLNALDGAAFVIENRTPFGVGITGKSTIRLAKDRPGQLRRRSLPSKGGLHWFGDLILNSHGEDYADLTIQAPTERSDDFRPTGVMTKLWKTIDLHAHDDGLSGRKVQDLAGGNASTNRQALTFLEVDGYISKAPHKPLKTYPPAPTAEGETS